MLSKNKIKYIKSLDLRKFRKSRGEFIAEGNKLVGDLLVAGWPILSLVATREWITKNKNSIPSSVELLEVNYDELKKASLHASPQDVLAIGKIPETEINTNLFKTDLTLCLDEVQDPGNLGTIIRLADWFGIKQVICSVGCADIYGPKAIQATMGAVARVNVIYTDIVHFLKDVAQEHIPVYATTLQGENIYQTSLENFGIIIMGNEGNGIRTEVLDLVSKHLLIPSYPKGVPTSESLNVAMATAITCAEFRRSMS